MRDLRKYARQTTFRLITGGLILIFIVGIGLIYVFYGPSAAVSGILCMLAGLSPLIFIALAFWFIDIILKRSQNN